MAMNSPDAETMIGFLADENPQSKRSDLETAGKAAAVLTRLALDLPSEQRQRLADGARFQARVLTALTDALQSTDEPVRSAQVVGAGLGRLLTESEGVGRLQVAAEPLRLERWAGPVAGATELQRELGIPRSTLQLWRRQGSVIGLLKGVKREVFPLRQFVDGRPVQGLVAVSCAIPSRRVAWLWLITPHPELRDRSPIDRLIADHLDEVVELARADYGQP